ncbi:MAG: hypothetical protein HYZ71_11060 [Deltaproteobacteria bacterium]|nr:hypothetical protein [Deltaproteobacteria bacterium]
MKIVFGIPFGEYTRKRKIPENSTQYQRLEQLYNQIQQLHEFISHSYQFRPIGRETAQLYFAKLHELGVRAADRDKLIENVGEIQAFVDAHIDMAKSKEREFLAEFERIASSLEIEE